ncbi:hypothetical protein D3OALGA1CA_4063 [Olavius algarvensis associated proteobacterium Delta 3]|nr:hypothetical protein D3OALGA1CA_4063 [Olavius algarvensis associated proteobacterium Delta 3]
MPLAFWRLCACCFSLSPPASAAKTPTKPVKPAAGKTAASQSPSQVLDVIVKINRLEDALGVVDQLYSATQKDPAQSPTMLLRGMLQGTDWIDASRPIVIGIEIREPTPAMAAMIPFVDPNPSFMTSFGAQPGPGYYLIGLPPGEPVTLSEVAMLEMAGAVQVPGDMSVTIDVALGRILKTREGQIRERLSQMATLPNADKMTEAGLTPEKLGKMLDTAAQIGNISFGLNLDRTEISTLFEMIAENGTPLSDAITKTDRPTSLQGYATAHQVNFRSREYDIQGLTAILLSAFGELYQQMGIDVKGMQDILASFTGEMAGGMSYGPGGITFEMIALMKGAATSGDFIENTYLPWLENYSRTFEKKFEKDLGRDFGPLWVRTKPSQVAGYRVVGEKFQMPAMPGADNALNTLMNYEVRLAMVGDKFIIAPDDRRMAELIKTAKTVKKAPASGPLMTADIDMGSYMGGIMGIIPGMDEMVGTLPKTGRITVSADMENGRAYARTSIPTRDIGTLVAYFAQLDASVKKTAFRPSEEKPEAVAGADKTKQPLNPETDPDYWIDKGALAATYGADTYAIKYFQKALALDSKRSDAYFQMGISYGELRAFAEAIEAIEKAIAIDPQRGVYYYGRGRVFLMSGETSLAIEDFRIAADLGSEDARRYLELTAEYEAE